MLKEKRRKIIEYVKSHRSFLEKNSEALNIYEGNLLPYVDKIMKDSLSPNYYNAIKDRILPINVLQRFIDKVSATYSNSPKRTSKSETIQSFVDYYVDQLSLNQSGNIADVYSNLFKGFAWEPYIDKNGKPAIRELPFNSFLVMSDSIVSPEEETIFIKIMGQRSSDEDSVLLHVYTDAEFDAFYLSGVEATEYLRENEGVNVVGVIPFVYGKRQKNRLIPILDSDMLKITKAIPVMLSDAAGAQMFQAFSILYGINLNFDNAVMAPNVIWSLKSDQGSEVPPQVGTIKPEADTGKIVEFVMTTFILWLETKGVRVGSVGNVDAGNTSSGIAKVIDEMDVYELHRRSQEWFTKDESELWNEKLPKIHNYWIKSGLVIPADVPAMIPDGTKMDVVIKFDKPEPMKPRMDLISEIREELSLGTMTMDQAVRALHPEYDQLKIDETLNNRALI